MLLETVDRPAGEVVAGRLLVARSVALDGDRHALLGRVPVVSGEVQDEFEQLLQGLDARGADPDRLWRDSGGELAAAAWAWPEEREHTREGDTVAASHVSFAVPDVDAMIKALDGSIALERTGQDCWDSEVIIWHWHASGRAVRTHTTPEEPGVRSYLCDEDTADPPVDGRVELNLDYSSVWLFAPTPARLEGLEERFTSAFAGLYGEPLGRGVERPSIVPRWQRERWERKLTALAPVLRRVRAGAR